MIDKARIRELLQEPPSAAVLMELYNMTGKRTPSQALFDSLASVLCADEATDLDVFRCFTEDDIQGLVNSPTAKVIATRIWQVLQTDVSEPNLVSNNMFHTLEPRFKPRSPSKVKLHEACTSMGKTAFLSFHLEPLAIPPKDSGCKLISFMKTSSELDSLASTLTEGTFNMTIVKHPSQMESKGSNKTASTILAENYPGDMHQAQGKLVVPNRKSKPECGAGIRTPGKPTMSLEWKGYDDIAIEEIIQTSSGHIQASYFLTDPRGLQSSAFYEEPPCGLAFLACGPSFLCAFRVELVGILHLSVYAGACSVGSSEHLQFLKELEDAPVVAPIVDLGSTQFESCEISGTKTLWTKRTVDGSFYKVIAFDQYYEGKCHQHGISRPLNWRRLYQLYKKYSGLENLPTVLVKARMLFGEYQVAVQMPFSDGFDITTEETVFTTEQKALLAQGLAFLFDNGFVYVDFRPPNLLTNSEGALQLIDYDDMFMFDKVEDGYICFEGVEKKLREEGDPFSICIADVIQAYMEGIRS